MERDFLMRLSSPNTWHELALSGLLDNPSFVSYLEQLRLAWSETSRRAKLPHPLALWYLQVFVASPDEMRKAWSDEGFVLAQQTTLRNHLT